MKKLIAALFTIALLVGCTKQEGAKFEGVWTSVGKDAETLTISKAGDGYRAVSEFADPNFKFMNMEAKLESESDTLLVRKGKRALELVDGNTVKSYMRQGEKTFTRAN